MTTALTFNTWMATKQKAANLNSPCEDSLSWSKAGAPSKDCEWVFKKQRCDAEDDDGVAASAPCPVPAEKICDDSRSWLVDGKDDKGCAYVAEKPEKRCEKTDEAGVDAYAACPNACGTGCDAAPSCADSTTWLVEGKEDKGKGCDYVSEKPEKRCDKADASGVLAFVACPLSCETCDCQDSFADSTSWLVGGKEGKDCDYVSEKPEKRCDKEDEFDVDAYAACPVACGTTTVGFACE